MKKVSTLLCMFSFIIISSLPAFAYHWSLAGQGNYVDVDSIHPTKTSNYYTGEGSGDIYTMWTKYVADEQPIERMFGKDVWSARAKVAIDCGNRTATRLSYYAYDAEGFAIAEYPKVNEKLLNITEDMEFPAAEIFNFVCSGEYKKHAPHRHNTWKFGD